MPVLGIDVGTTGSRALLLGEDGRLIASTTADHVPFRSQDYAPRCAGLSHADRDAASRAISTGER